MASPYDVLGVDPDDDEETIRRAYRERVKQAHPDHGGSVREFQLVRAAYDRILSDDTDAAGEALHVGRDDESDRSEQRHTRVEYLDYEVLDDYGWSLDDEDLFEKASAAGLDPAAHGRFVVQPDESLLEAAENRGFTWPYACRGGACANCAVAVVEGELVMPPGHVLTEELLDRGIRLSCNGRPITSELRVVYNVKGLPCLDDLQLPPVRFERAQSGQ